MNDYTKYTRVQAKQLKGCLAGVQLTKADSYALAEDEKTAYVGVTLSAASKVLTLGLNNGDVAFIHNEGGTNAFTVKNLSGDTGTSLAAGKTVLVVASTTANGTKMFALD